MFKYITILFIACKVFSIPAYSQEKAYSHDDTLQAISYLEYYTDKYPTHRISGPAMLKLAELDVESGNYELAYARLMKALPEKQTSWKDSFDVRYYFMLDRFRFEGHKQFMCMLLSDIHLKQDNAAEALRYLQLADGDFFGAYTCGNEAASRKAELCIKFADLYLYTGDTANAVARLLDAWSRGEGSISIAAAKQLHLLLLQHYTPDGINKEIDRSINAAKVTTHARKSYVQKTVHLVLFGHKVTMRYDGDNKDAGDYLRRNYYLHMLTI